MFQYSKNLEGTKTAYMTPADIDGFQYSKNLEGTKTLLASLNEPCMFQYSKNLEGTKTCSSFSICLKSFSIAKI